MQYEALRTRKYKGLFVIFALYLRVLRAWFFLDHADWRSAMVVGSSCT